MLFKRGQANARERIWVFEPDLVQINVLAFGIWFSIQTDLRQWIWYSAEAQKSGFVTSLVSSAGVGELTVTA